MIYGAYNPVLEHDIVTNNLPCNVNYRLQIYIIKNEFFISKFYFDIFFLISKNINAIKIVDNIDYKYNIQLLLF